MLEAWSPYLQLLYNAPGCAKISQRQRNRLIDELKQILTAPVGGTGVEKLTGSSIQLFPTTRSTPISTTEQRVKSHVLNKIIIIVKENNSNNDINTRRVNYEY